MSQASAEFNSAFNWPEFNSIHKVLYTRSVTLRSDGAPVTLEGNGAPVTLRGDGAPVVAE
jgi:hypothetical protein